jgi:ammonium transporter, Amt family
MSLPALKYNGTAPDGGDSSNPRFSGPDNVATFNVNLWYTTGDVAWVLTSTALVWLMIPGVGFFYSGLARRKSALSLIFLSLMSVSIVSFQVLQNVLY